MREKKKKEKKKRHQVDCLKRASRSSGDKDDDTRFLSFVLYQQHGSDRPTHRCGWNDSPLTLLDLVSNLVCFFMGGEREGEEGG